MEIRPALRRTLTLIAEGVVEFSGFQVAAVSVVDGDELEVVAVVGDDAAARELTGTRVPTELVARELELGEHWGALRFVPAERGSGGLEAYEWVPPLAPATASDVWDPRDLLCALLCDEEGRVRGLFSVDLPVDGLRPDATHQHVLQRYVRLAERALVVELDREAVEERRDHEQAVAEFRRRLLDTLSHELCGSTAAIGFTVGLLHDHARCLPLDPGSLDRLTRDSVRISSVVQDMGALVRLERPDPRPRNRPIEVGTVALGAVVQEAVALHEATARLGDVRIEVDGDDRIEVVGDRQDLGHAISNLVSNAVKYCRAGGRVRVALHATGYCTGFGPGVGAPLAALTVSDDGIGIVPDDHDRVLRECYRGPDPEVQARPGAGLGLAIVERVVRRHHGLLSIDSLPGRGTTFRVLLPAADPAAAQCLGSTG